jgi:hypothetical protein
MVVIGFPPEPLPGSPGSSLLLKMLRGPFPLIPLGTSAIKVSAGASFKMPNMGRRSQNSESCQRKPQENCKRCNTPERCMDQHSDPAAGLGSALRSLALHTSVTRRCHFSGLGPLPPDQRQEFMLPIKVRTKVKEPGQQEPSDPPLESIVIGWITISHFCRDHQQAARNAKNRRPRCTSDYNVFHTGKWVN